MKLSNQLPCSVANEKTEISSPWILWFLCWILWRISSKIAKEIDRQSRITYLNENEEMAPYKY